MPYLTSEEYKEMTGKTLSDPFILQIVEDYIDLKTFYRIKDFNSLSDFQKKLIKKASAYITQVLDENKDFLYSNIKSYNLNGIQMTLDNATDSFSNNSLINQANSCLTMTGLCYRGLW